MAAFGIKAIQPEDNEHILGFATARATQDMSVLEVWNGPTSADLVYTLDKDGQHQSANGTASRPTYAWENSKTTGWYRIGADNVGFAVTTTKLLDLAATSFGVTGAISATTTGTFGGIVSVDDTTDTTSTTTGSIHTDGGLGIAKALWVGTTSRFVGVTTHGGNVVSDTDSTDSLGTTGVRWAKLWVDDITMGGTFAGAAITCSTIVASGIVKTDDVTDATSGTDGSLQTDGGLSVAKAAWIGTTVTADAYLASADNSGALGASGTAFSDLFLASGAVINFNAGDVTLTHSANTLAIAGGAVTIDSTLDITGTHVQVTSATPRFRLDESDAAADNQSWDFTCSSGQLRGRVLNDADSVASSWVNVDRTGTTVDTVAFPGTAVTLAGTLAVTGDASILNDSGLVIGHTAIIATAGHTNEFQMHGTGAFDSSVTLNRWSANTSSAKVVFFKSRATSVGGSATTIVTGDNLGEIVAYGDDGTDYDTPSSAIVFDTEGTISAGQVPGQIRLQTAAAGTLTTAITISSAQAVAMAGTLAVTGTISGSTQVLDQLTADGISLDLRSTGDVTHGMTDFTNTATYFTVLKRDADTGGVFAIGYSEDKTGLYGIGRATNDDTAKSTAAIGYIMLGGEKKSGTGRGAVGANANIVVIRNLGTAVWLADAEGDTWQSGGATVGGTLAVTGLITATAGITSGSNIVSDTDSTDDLGATGTRWANLWVDAITMGGTLDGAVATFSSTLAVTGTSAFTGNVGIGQAAGSEALEILETTTGEFALKVNHSHATVPGGIAVVYTGGAPNDTTHYFFRGTDNAPATRVELRSNGGIGNFQSNDADLSDERLKQKYGRLDSTWGAHKDLEFWNFKYLDNLDSRMMAGVMAQQVAEVAPALFSEYGWGDNEHHAVNNKDLNMYTARTVQECQHRVETNEEKIKRLEAEVVDINAVVASMRSSLS